MTGRRSVGCCQYPLITALTCCGSMTHSVLQTGQAKPKPVHCDKNEEDSDEIEVVLRKLTLSRGEVERIWCASTLTAFLTLSISPPL